MTIDTQMLLTGLLFLLNVIFTLLLMWLRSELKALHVEIDYLKQSIAEIKAVLSQAK